jgi:hypothetical protein
MPWLLPFFLDRKGEYVRCLHCGYPLLRVSPGATWHQNVKRGSLIVCGNHCDRICPLCAGECERVEDDSVSGRGTFIECDDCGWQGSLPDRDFVTAVEEHDRLVRRRQAIEKEDERIRSAILRSNSLRTLRNREVQNLRERGVLCPRCRRRPVTQARERVLVNDTGRRWLALVTRCPSCGPIGDPVWLEYATIGAAPDQTPASFTRAPEFVGQCKSCGTVIRTGGRCGCS